MFWETCDAAIAIGCRLQAERMTWGMDDEIKIIHVDIDPTEINRVAKPDVGIVGDASTVTEEIINALTKYNRLRPSRETEFQNIKKKALRLMEEKVGPQMAWLRQFDKHFLKMDISWMSSRKLAMWLGLGFLCTSHAP